MELMAQSVSWFYPSFPGRYLVMKCLRIVLGLVSVFPRDIFFSEWQSCSVISPLSTRRCVDIMVASGYYMSTDDEE